MKHLLYTKETIKLKSKLQQHYLNEKIKYNTAGDFTLFSSNLWFNSLSANTINLQFGNSVKVWDNSTVSISQNDVQATVYLLDGTATVYTSTGKNISLAKGEQITLSRQDSIDEEVDLVLLKKEFWEFFKVNDWYIKNNGNFFLNRSQEVATITGETVSGTLVSNSSTALTSIFDESSVSSSPIKLEWKYDTSNTSAITINGISAELDEQTGLFKIDQFALRSKTNDLVIKTYDVNKSITSKQVYTVYYPNGSDAAVVTSAKPSTSDTTIYDVDATKFSFTYPSSSGKFATTGSEITIRGLTTAEGISKVTVDDFELKSFNGTTWRYHAFARFNNLQNGTNQYEIKYFWEDGDLVYTDYYTIVKKVASSIIPAQKAEEVISDEV